MATTIKAIAWDAGGEPIEASNGEDYALQHWLMGQLDTKEYGKFVRSYPGNETTPPGDFAMLYRAFTDPHRGRVICSGMDEEDLTKSYEMTKLYCTQRVFSPAELYALKPVRTDYGYWHTINVHLGNEIPNYYDIDSDKVEAAKRMETRTLVDHDYDGRRGWTLQTVWFDGKPVMVVNSSGRDGDEYHDRWITDGQAFADMVAFLNTCIKEDALVSSEFVEASKPIPAMTEFYNHTIHDYYDVEAQEPKKK